MAIRTFHNAQYNNYFLKFMLLYPKETVNFGLSKRIFKCTSKYFLLDKKNKLINFLISHKVWGLSLGIVGVLGGFFTPSVQAANLVWESVGDVEIDGTTLRLSTDGLWDDDIDLGANPGDFNFSGNPATFVGFGGLENFLGVDVTELDLDIDNIAFEGSAIKTTLNLSSRTEVSFDWEFLTNETSGDLLSSFLDYGFFFLGQDVTKLADVTDTIPTTCSFGFDSCTGVKTRTFTLNPGDYSFGFGVIDINDVVVTSGLIINNVSFRQVTDDPVSTPEPNLIFGLFGIAGLGPKFLRQKRR